MMQEHTKEILHELEGCNQSSTPPPATKEERFKLFLGRGWFDDLNERITRPNFRFNICGVDCVPSGEIIAVAGKPGAGKSTTLAILVGILLGRTEFAGIRCLTPCSKVLWIDTEKGEYTCQQKMRVFRNVAHIGNNEKLVDIGIHFALLRQETTEDRRYFIEELAKREHYDAVVIDGVFDLTMDPDKDYAPVTDMLRRLAATGASVFAMLHTNKASDDNNMRYALGTELQRLCTTRFTVEFKNNQHIIKHDKSNDSALAPQVAFTFSENGDVVPVSASKDEETRNTAKEKEIRDVMTEVFADTVELGYNAIVESYKLHGCVEVATAKRKLKDAKTFGIIELIPETGKYRLKVT